MWQLVRSLYNNHIILHKVYISSDDVIDINGIIYEIIGISDDDVFITDKNNKMSIYPAPAFVQMLKDNGFKFIRNMHQENIEKNKLYA